MDGSLPSASAVFVCMPTGRECALFFGGGLRFCGFPEWGTGGGVFGGSLQSAVALLVYMPAGREVERAELFCYYLSFRRSTFPEHGARGGISSGSCFFGGGVRFCRFPEWGTGGGVFGGSLQSAVALLEYMPAGREVERAELFIINLSFRRSIFPEQGATGGISSGSLPSKTALLVCMAAGREADNAERLFYFT